MTVDLIWKRSGLIRKSRRALLGAGLGAVAAPALLDAKKRKRRKKPKKCKSGTTRCKKTCVDTRSSKTNCGRCGNSCQGELSCVGGDCQCTRAICGIASFYSDTSPNGIVVDAVGQLITTDDDSDQVVIYSTDGQVVRRIGEFGIDPGEFDSPSGVALGSDGSIYVADGDNDRIQRITASGQVDVWPLAMYAYPQAVAVTEDGVVYASFDGQISHLNQNGEVVHSWDKPTGTDHDFYDVRDLAMGDEGSIYVVDDDENLVMRCTDDGTGNLSLDWIVGAPGVDPGEFRYPTGIGVGGGRVFIADQDNFRIQVLRADDGSFLFDWELVDEYGDRDWPRDVALGPNGRVYVTGYSEIYTFVIGPDAPQ